MTRTEIRDLFGRHRSAHRLEAALTLLDGLGRLRKIVVETGGRPAERWELASDQSDQSDQRSPDTELQSLMSLPSLDDRDHPASE
jgi:hypothetical protein